MRKLNDRSRTWANDSNPSDNEIRDRAYEKWIQHGCQEGREMENWLEAERELREQADEVETVQR